MSKHQPARKRLKKSTLAASTLTCCVFICTNLEQTRNTRPIGHFTMAGTLQVAKLWHAGFSYVQTSSKPCSNLKSMGPDETFPYISLIYYSNKSKPKNINAIPQNDGTLTDRTLYSYLFRLPELLIVFGSI